MNRVLILGIDAMDADLLSRFEAELPTLRRLRSHNPLLTLTSTYPPDTPTAWASAYTGLNPAQHGIVYFVDPLEKVSILASQDLSADPVRGKTFWDIASQQGKRVCVLFPFLGFPAWPVNGIMVGKSTNRYNKGPHIDCFPSSLAGEIDFTELNPIFSVPQKKRHRSYTEGYRRMVLAERELSLMLLKKEKWDIFFMYSSALDWLGHNLWSYFDETDPAYPGVNPYQGILLEFYKLYDRMVGDLIEASGADTTTIVFSDHGFTQRPSKLFNVNELLHLEGLLAPKAKNQIGACVSVLELAKKTAVRTVNRFGAGGMTMWMVHHLPALRRQFTVPQTIDWEKTIAYVSDLSGIKAYSYGGIIMSRDKLGGAYDETRSRIIKKLADFKEPLSGDYLVKWAKRREELYSGPHLGKYPDIVYQLKTDYGVGWAVNEPLVAVSASHNIQPGTHRADTAVFLMSGSQDACVCKNNATLMDIAPTIFAVLGIPRPLAAEAGNQSGGLLPPD